MREATPFFMSFAQFLAAPRAGRLGDALRRMPSRPLTADEVLAANEMEEAKAAMRADGAGAMAARSRYDAALRSWNALRATMREATDRWLYDRAVEAGVIIPTQIEPDPAGELEKMEKKADREREKERRKEADKLLPEALETAEISDDPMALEDAALDYAENGMGRFYFAQQWAANRDLERLSTWLSTHGYTVDPASVMEVLDQLAESGLWRQ